MMFYSFFISPVYEKNEQTNIDLSCSAWNNIGMSGKLNPVIA